MIKKIQRFFFILTLSVCCLLVGSSFAWGLNLRQSEVLVGSVDEVPERYQNGLQMYQQTCSGCHIAIPPEVLPIETWQRLLEKPNDHYGTSVTGLIRLTQVLIWDYLRTYSRPLDKDEPLPFYVEKSRYFKALHPKVKLPEIMSHQTCLVCHPKAGEFNFRSLTPEWENQ